LVSGRAAHSVVPVVVAYVTVPVGLAVPDVKSGVTVAVKATCWLTAAEAGEDATLVVVPVAITICVVVPIVPDAKFVSPL
jgi:hypothetical protein